MPKLRINDSPGDRFRKVAIWCGEQVQALTPFLVRVPSFEAWETHQSSVVAELQSRLTAIHAMFIVLIRASRFSSVASTIAELARIELRLHDIANRIDAPPVYTDKTAPAGHKKYAG
jgi:hypothetical protein